MNLDPKGLEAAAQAMMPHDPGTQIIEIVRKEAERAITAYLSTTPPDVDGLVDAQTEARAIARWQPIDTAPKEPVAEGASFGPMILLGSIYGHRAIGYWGRGRGNQRYGWVNPHDHMVVDYWGALTHWQPLPEIPENENDA